VSELQVEFAWSKSRHELFQKCARSYWYSYYGSWGGWKKNHPARKAYILNKMTNRYAWVGNVVHNAIEGVLRNAKRHGWAGFEAENVIERAVAQMRLDLKASKQKKYIDDPKKYPGFTEHYYEENVSDAQWIECRDKVQACLAYFFQCDIFINIKKSDFASWIKFEELDSYVINGANMWVKLDFGLVLKDILHIFDWKTSKEMMTKEAAVIQLAHYAKYAMLKLGHDLNKIRVHEVNVHLREKVSYDVTEDMIATLDNFRNRSCEAIFEPFGHDPSTSAANLKGFIPDKNKFPIADTKRPCKFCNFKGICEKFNE